MDFEAGHSRIPIATAKIDRFQPLANLYQCGLVDFHDTDSSLMHSSAQFPAGAGNSLTLVATVLSRFGRHLHRWWRRSTGDCSDRHDYEQMEAALCTGCPGR